MPRTWFLAPMDLEELPQGVRYPHLAIPEGVVSRYIERYSRPGQVVFDPFAGYGSTLLVANRLGRQAYGIEIDPECIAYASKILPDETILLQGDARNLFGLDLPDVDLCFTGPPFFASDRLTHMDIPSLSNTYDEYLANLTSVFDGVQELLRPGGHLVTLFCNLTVPANFWNPNSSAGLFPLSWDAAKAIAQVIPLIAEEIWCISEGEGRSPFAGRHGQFLIFQKPAGRRSHLCRSD